MKKKNGKAMGKARKQEAPGILSEAQISTRHVGNLSFGNKLDLHENVAEKAIDRYLGGSKNYDIQVYFDAQLDIYKKKNFSCSKTVKHRWIRNLICVFNELFLTGEGEEILTILFLWPEVESTFTSDGNDDRYRY